MKVLGFKKLFVSLGLGVILMFGTAAAVSAAAGAVLEQCTEPAEEPVISGDGYDFDIPQAYLSSADRVKAVQISAAKETSGKLTMSFKWNHISGTSTYEIGYGPYQAREDYKFKNFAPVQPTSKEIQDGVIARKISGGDLIQGTPYTVRIRACSGSLKTDYTYFTCFTVYDKIKVTNVSYKNDTFTYKLNAAEIPGKITYNFISGYKVSYYSYNTQKTVTKYYKNRAGFSIKPAPNTFYKVIIRPFLTLNGKIVVCPAAATQYMAQQPKLSKKGYTTNSMTIGWQKYAGASSYTVFIKYPGTSVYKKVKTTTGLTYKLTGMKPNKDYFVKVIANRGSAHSPSVYYYRMNLAPK